jgi:hypothetical protein
MKALLLTTLVTLLSVNAYADDADNKKQEITELINEVSDQQMPRNIGEIVVYTDEVTNPPPGSYESADGNTLVDVFDDGSWSVSIISENGTGITYETDGATLTITTRSVDDEDNVISNTVTIDLETMLPTANEKDKENEEE